ncbi:hypothetical protein JCM10296v2_001694 [Rhodotorula toruloides]
MGSMDRDAQKGLTMEYAELGPKFKFANLCRRGPAGLAILRRRYFDRNPCVGPVPPQAPFPSNVAAYSALSFASLDPSPSQIVQQAGQREPGLVVVSSNVAVVRFWDSVSFSLSGDDRSKSASPFNPSPRAVASVWSAVSGSKTVDLHASILALALSQPKPNEAEQMVYALK